jgi:hypothetical protein
LDTIARVIFVVTLVAFVIVKYIEPGTRIVIVSWIVVPLSGIFKGGRWTNAVAKRGNNVIGQGND